MNLKERAKRLKTDIPTVLLALKNKDTTIIAKIMAAITVRIAARCFNHGFYTGFRGSEI